MAVTIKAVVRSGRPANHGARDTAHSGTDRRSTPTSRNAANDGTGPSANGRTAEGPLIGRIGIAPRKSQADDEDCNFRAHPCPSFSK
jgi:hypothetical protein